MLTPKLNQISEGLDDKITKLVYGGRPVPAKVGIDKAEVNNIMEKLNGKLAEKSKKLKQLDT